MGTRIETTDLARDALYTKVNQIADEKQDVLEFDTTPTANSNNPVTSNGIKSALDVKANDNAVIHLTSDETITGNKTFSGNLIKQSNSLEYKGIHIQNTQLTKGTTPSSTAGGQFVFQDKDGLGLVDRIGGVEITYNTAGNTQTQMIACQPVANSTTYASISITYPASGNPYTEAPTPTDTTTTSGKQIATTGWANTAGDSANNIVHKTGTETIAGEKTFTSNITINRSSPYIYERCSDATKGTALAQYRHSGYMYTDKDGKELAGLINVYNTDKSTYSEIRAYLANSASDTGYSYIRVGKRANGDDFATAPTPAVSASGTTIATAGYINNKFKKVSTLPASPDANTFYFIPE